MQEGRILLNAHLRSVQLYSPSGDQAAAFTHATPTPMQMSPSPILPAAIGTNVADQQPAQVNVDREAMHSAWKTLEMRIREVTEQNRLQLAELSQAAIEMAVLMAEKMVGQQIASGTYAVDQIVNEAVERMSAEERLTVRLHPEDLRLLETILGDVTPGDSQQHVTLRADASLVRGDCLVEAANHGLLSSVSKQLADMRSSLLESLNVA